jgi:hypothetical protein
MCKSVASGNNVSGLSRLNPMNRFVHRIVMFLLLIAALAIIWYVLGGR